jgi:CRISPR system Cascade subunit CasB
MKRMFEKDYGSGKVLYDWWHGLDADRASRAILRRAHSITAVTLAAPYQRINQRLCAAGWKDCRSDGALAAVIGLLAHVKEHDGGKPVATSMGQRLDGRDRPCVSELRFRRLLDAPDAEALFVGLRRALPLMSHRVDVMAFANDIVDWGDQVKKKWAYSYDWPAKSND